MKDKINDTKSSVLTQKSKNKDNVRQELELTSRVFLASSHCRGTSDNYLFAFGAE
ncbi:hypothetical protein N6H18_08435 [Reichenbachiella agarivorans]|uniref:Uncharacterized protein n=1 Tax=Reichenbachiella agarivorans TaxID=2979464 RepID=A0ABY6CTY0_9BACT|nr:hypothetical protein [Reichenbachiella agarivorans]UXP33971.1 hypothetical protein N6H18_08435 [Reichenbachiella agarivorans]